MAADRQAVQSEAHLAIVQPFSQVRSTMFLMISPFMSAEGLTPNSCSHVGAMSNTSTSPRSPRPCISGPAAAKNPSNFSWLSKK